MSLDADINFVYPKINFDLSQCVNLKSLHLYNNIYYYTATYKNECAGLKAYISENGYVPLTFTIKFNVPIDVSNLKELLTVYIQKYYNLEIDNIECKYINETNICFTPLILLWNTRYFPIFTTPKDPIFKLNIIGFLGLKFISTYELTSFAYLELLKTNFKNVKRIEPESKYEFEPESKYESKYEFESESKYEFESESKYESKSDIYYPKLVNINGIYCMKSDQKEFIENLKLSIQKYTLLNYFYYSDSYISELITLWPIIKIENNIYSSSELDYEFIDTAIKSIKSGNLIKYVFVGNWMLENDKNLENRVLLYYLFTKKYTELFNINQALITYLDKICVNYDLSINCYVCSYSEVLFLNQFYTNLEGLSYSIFDSLEFAIANRFKIQLLNSDLQSLIVPIQSKYYLVVNSKDYVLNLTTDDDISYFNTHCKLELKDYLSLYGYFDNGNLKGLTNYTTLKPVNLNTILSMDSDNNVYVDDIYLCNLSDLYTNIQNTDELLQKLTVYFNIGVFFNDWGLSLYYYFNTINKSNLTLQKFLTYFKK
jgi:hypothetical protein